METFRQMTSVLRLFHRSNPERAIPPRKKKEAYDLIGGSFSRDWWFPTRVLFVLIIIHRHSKVYLTTHVNVVLTSSGDQNCYLHDCIPLTIDHTFS